MAKPPIESIDPVRLTELARAVIQADRFPYLATIDGDQPRLRPVSPVRTDGFTVYVANLRSYHKTMEIAKNPRVELCYLDDHHDQVRITGLAEVVSERTVLQEIWDANPLLRQYLGTIDNPELIVYRIVPSHIRFMKEWALNYHDVPLTGTSSAKPARATAKKAHHIVLLKFKPATTAAVIAELFARLGQLRQTIAGIDHYCHGPYASPEGMNQGYTHGFIMTFRDAACRDVYLTHPHHEQVKEAFLPSVENVVAFDFEE